MKNFAEFLTSEIYVIHFLVIVYGSSHATVSALRTEYSNSVFR